MGFLPFVNSIVHLPAATSTNDVAKAYASEGHRELPLLVRTDRQTKGRGRGTNVWWSDEGSLTFSLLFDPLARDLGREQEPKVALAAAVAVVEAIREHVPGCSPGIRWPNDVEVDGRKLGGLLTERVETALGPRLVLGIGLNVATRLDQAPPAIARMAASLAEWTPIGLDAMLGAILGRLDSTLRELSREEITLYARWARFDTLLNQRVRIDLGGSLVEGIGRGIESSGGLRVATAGDVQTIHAGQVLRD